MTELIELQGIGVGGTVRFNINHLVGYNENELWLLGTNLDLLPGTAIALDKTLKERSGIAFIRVEPVAEEGAKSVDLDDPDFIHSLKQSLREDAV
jgi:hypothetical protein